jgi:hypothetical protein
LVSIAAYRHRNLAPPPEGAKWGAKPPGAVGADIRLENPRSLCIRTSAPRPKDSKAGGTCLTAGGATTPPAGAGPTRGAV